MKRNTAWRLEYMSSVESEPTHSRTFEPLNSSRNWLARTPIPVRSMGPDTRLMRGVSATLSPSGRDMQSMMHRFSAPWNRPAALLARFRGGDHYDGFP